MTYLEWAMLYLAVGALLFLPMLYMDEETHHYARVTKLRMLAAFVVWCVVWFPSMAIDLLFWLLRGPSDLD